MGNPLPTSPSDSRSHLKTVSPEYPRRFHFALLGTSSIEIMLRRATFRLKLPRFMNAEAFICGVGI